MAATEPTGTVASRPWRRLFSGPFELRAGWRLLIFFAILALLTRVRGVVVRKALGGLDGITLYVLDQATRFLFCLLAAWLLGRFEGRTIAEYGLPWRQSFRLRFWQGVLAGFAALSALLALMRLAGVFHLGSIAVSGAELATEPRCF